MLNTIILLVGGFLLSIIHILVPNNWVPIVSVSKTEGWKGRELSLFTALISMAHFLSTFLLGFIMGIVAYRLALFYNVIAKVVAPSVLIGLGVIYLIFNFLQNEKEYDTIKEPLSRSKIALVLSIALAAFFSPSIEMSFYYFLAGSHGLLNIVLLSLVFAGIVISLSIFLVLNGVSKGDKFRWRFLEEHERLIKGMLLIFFGVIGFFLKK